MTVFVTGFMTVFLTPFITVFITYLKKFGSRRLRRADIYGSRRLRALYLRGTLELFTSVWTFWEQEAEETCNAALGAGGSGALYLKV